MLPEIGPQTGRLPPGEHVASWDEVVDRFGWTERRRRLLDGLAEAIDLLAAAGCRRVWVNGSFVTAKDDRATSTRAGTPTVSISTLLSQCCWISDHRREQKERFGGELFPNVIETQSGLSFAEFFQSERDTGRKGIVVINIEGDTL